MIKYLWVDTETSGWDPKTCGLLQLSGYVEIDNEIKETFDFKMKPYGEVEWMQEAMDKTHLTPEVVENFEDPSVVFNQFISILEKYVDRFDEEDKFFLIGYNVKFDEDFLREWFMKEAKTERDRMYGNGFGAFFWTPSIDVMNYAAVRTMSSRHNFPSFRLGPVCRTLGIEFNEEDAHNAMFDIEKTRELWKFLKGGGRSN